MLIELGTISFTYKSVRLADAAKLTTASDTMLLCASDLMKVTVKDTGGIRLSQYFQHRGVT